MEKPTLVDEMREMDETVNSSPAAMSPHLPDPELKNADPTDMNNPQNWSRTRKNLLFLALMGSSLLADGAMVWGGTLVTPQAMEWGVSVAHSATSMNYGILLQGFGGMFAVPLIEAYGRYPVWIWPQVITMFMVLGATLSHDWSTFTVFRSLQGLFGTVPQVIGLPIIHDMYSPEEWPRMVNIWGTTFMVGPFLGPAIAGYIGAGTNWRDSFGVLTALYGLSTFAVLAFGAETYYNPGKAPTSRVGAYFGVGNTKLPKGSTLWYWCKVMVLYVFKFPLLMTGLGILITFTWPIGITTTIDSFLHSPPYNFDTIEASSMRFAGVIGALCGWLVGYLFNGWVYKRYHANWWTEYRLHGVWVPLGSLTFGLLTYGLTMNFGKHWIGIAFGWIMVNIGMVAIIVAVTAYALEKYPEQSTVVSAILNMWRTCGGFAVGYFQPAWIARNGLGLVFGIQAIIVSVSVVLCIVPVLITQRRKSSVGAA
ncbi:uncharacterized protein N7482_007679 [Penicillium canariense]|uniref:Major facilitator superfamily (MFS) profile domain-containing protein n=1 Tax=Penicillium canariense TaxID=189055 RepID=A0A9W9I256_9EURO|nr:uncharacterized protein N7482_007679 [Penicillium canariense]KAJ5160675.1 hypothetical protein N7482_007679 [Penicillium canariense]